MRSIAELGTQRAEYDIDVTVRLSIARRPVHLLGFASREATRFR
jgi:hypothetical protein